ncbi:MAG: DNA cytosine methyltransferase [Treponema brennaborense]|nr:DNA cytosine methyltransferase [Muribaculaceae bacterium]MCM1408115.1 DNA cytosine methyltransferase [Treponema brennaborense]
MNDNNSRRVLFEVCENVLKEKVYNEKNKPKAFVFENVRGILSSKMPDGVSVPDEIRIRMKRLVFSISQQLIYASDYGVFQQRYRVLIIGIYNPDNDKQKKFDFSYLKKLVKAENIPSLTFSGKEKLVLGAILKDIETPGEYLEYSKGTQYIIDKIEIFQ